MVQAHDRLQRAAAEMNTIRFSTTRSLSNADIESLSQQLSQIPADLSGRQSPVASSPASHRSKRSRIGDTPLARRIQRTPLTALKNRENQVNVTPMIIKATKPDQNLFIGSMTEDEESPMKIRSPAKSAVASSNYGELIADGERGFPNLISDRS
jgi:hypothetical protein